MKAAMTLGAIAGVALAQRPMNTSICDYYTTALLKDNTAKNQGTVLTLLVNTVVLGNAMPKPDIPGVTFPASVDGLDGILAPNATYMGKGALLAPYFTGALASSNRGDKPTAINFLDDGGADPLTKSMASNGNMDSHQYKLLTHLYEFFGTLLNCTEQGKGDDFKAYDGNPGMYDVHKYMALNSSQVGFFITQVGLAAKSFGVADDDVTAVGTALNNAFGMRCSAAAPVVPDSPQLQAICLTEDCPQAQGGDCSMYGDVAQPAVVDAAGAMGLGDASSTATGTMDSGSASGTATMDSGSSTDTSGAMASGTESAGGASGGSSASSSGGASAPTQIAGVLAAGGIAAAAFFL